MTFRASATATVNSGPSLTVNTPAGTVAGDTLVAVISHGSDAQTPTAPSGWTEVRGTQGQGLNLHTYVRVAVAAEPASHAWTFPDSSDAAGTILAYYAVSDVVSASASATGSVTPAVAASVTTTRDNATVLVAHTAYEVPTGPTLTTPAGTTLRASAEAVSQVYCSVQVADVEVATDGSASGTFSSTYTGSGRWIAHTIELVPNNPPNAPALLAPADGAVLDLNGAQRFDWDFSDPDADDTQSQYELRYRTVGSATWTTVGGSTPSTYRDIAGGTFAAGDYEWQVRTWDALGAAGPWASSAFFTAATPTGVPTITDPISGGTVDSDPYTVAWSTAGGQDAHQVRVVADDGAGGADELTIIYDTGQVNNTAARSAPVPFPDNGVYRHVQVRIYLDGLWSSWASHRVLVSYTPPPTPTVTPGADDSAGAVVVTYSTPAPAAGEPTVEYADVEVRDTSGRDKYRPAAGVRIGALLTPSGTFIDWLPAAGVNYEYRVIAFGDNGTTSASEWTPIDAEAAASVYYATY